MTLLEAYLIGIVMGILMLLSIALIAYITDDKKLTKMKKEKDV